jgi:hypothetical protein
MLRKVHKFAVTPLNSFTSWTVTNSHLKVEDKVTFGFVVAWRHLAEPPEVWTYSGRHNIWRNGIYPLSHPENLEKSVEGLQDPSKIVYSFWAAL